MAFSKDERHLDVLSHILRDFEGLVCKIRSTTKVEGFTKVRARHNQSNSLKTLTIDPNTLHRLVVNRSAASYAGLDGPPYPVLFLLEVVFFEDDAGVNLIHTRIFMTFNKLLFLQK